MRAANGKAAYDSSPLPPPLWASLLLPSFVEYSQVPALHVSNAIPTVPLTVAAGLVLWRGVVERRGRWGGVSKRGGGARGNSTRGGPFTDEGSNGPNDGGGGGGGGASSSSVRSSNSKGANKGRFDGACASYLQFRTLLGLLTVLWVALLHITFDSLDSASSVGTIASAKGRSCSRSLCMRPLNVLVGLLLVGFVLLFRALREVLAAGGERRRRGKGRRGSSDEHHNDAAVISDGGDGDGVRQPHAITAWLESTYSGDLDLTGGGITGKSSPPPLPPLIPLSHLVGLAASDCGALAMLAVSSLFATVPSYCILVATFPTCYYGLARYVWTRSGVVLRLRARLSIGYSGNHNHSRGNANTGTMPVDMMQRCAQFYRTLSVESLNLMDGPSALTSASASASTTGALTTSARFGAAGDARRAMEGCAHADAVALGVGGSANGSTVAQRRGKFRGSAANDTSCSGGLLLNTTATIAHEGSGSSLALPPSPSLPPSLSPPRVLLSLMVGLAPVLLAVSCALFNVLGPLYALIVDDTLWRNRPVMRSIMWTAVLVCNGGGQLIFYSVFLLWPLVRDYVGNVQALGGTLGDRIVASRFVNGLLRSVGALAVPRIVVGWAAADGGESALPNDEA